jgi:hypothetical protein
VVAMSRLDDTTWSGTYDGTIVEGDYLATVNGTDGAGNFVMGTAVSFVSDQVATGQRAGGRNGVFIDAFVQDPGDGHIVVRFGLPRTTEVEMCVYGPRGRLVRRLVWGRRRAGRHRVVWDGTGEHGQAVCAGVYTCTIRAEGQAVYRTLLLVR